MKPSDLIHSVHAYLAGASLTKAAKALRKEALLDQHTGATPPIVPLDAAIATWQKREKKKGRAAAADAAAVPRSVLAFLDQCKLAKASKALRKGASIEAGPAPPLLEAVALHLKKGAKKAKKQPEPVAETPPPAAAKPKKRKRAEGPSPAEARRAADAKKRLAARGGVGFETATEAADAWLAKQNATPRAEKAPTPTPKSKTRSPGTPFERIDSAKWMASIKDERMKDNTYAGTFGGGGWGHKASEKLMQVRGKKFQHEKTKKKRGGYRGGTVSLATASQKFVYSDDEG